MSEKEPPQPSRQTEVSLVCSSALEYLTFIADNEPASEPTIKQYLMVQAEGWREAQRKIAFPYVLLTQV